MEKLNFLIADNHAFTRIGVKKILHDEFLLMNAEEANTAEEAIVVLNRIPCDMVISEINLPGRSGIDLIKQLKIKYPKLPVLILSTYSEEHYGIRALNAGARGYVTKDKSAKEFRKAVRKVLSGHKYITNSLVDKLTDKTHLSQHKPMHEYLSDREFEVLKLISKGCSISEISSKLSLSLSTVSTYRFRMLQKMRFSSNAEIIYYAIKQDLI